MIDRSSRTAEHVALFRALETVRPGGGLVQDPFAARLLPGRHRTVVALSRVPGVHGTLVRYIDRRWPGGPRASAVVRTRLIDEWLAAALADGAGRVVLLGAGFDSRAHRPPAVLPTARPSTAGPSDAEPLGADPPAVGPVGAEVVWFEVDHPATQVTKRRRLGAHGRDGVVFVPADLSVDDLGGALRGGGFDPSVRTVVIWEGVTNYLTAAAVDATLRGIVALCPAGSTVVFTYVDRGVLDGTAAFAGAAGWHEAVKRQGEPWTFGFDPAGVGEYVGARGLRLVEDLSTRDAARRFLPADRLAEPTAEFYRVARTMITGTATTAGTATTTTNGTATPATKGTMTTRGTTTAAGTGTGPAGATATVAAGTNDASATGGD